MRIIQVKIGNYTQFRWEDKADMEAAQIVVKRSRGTMVVQATGLTGKGQKYLKGSVTLKARTIRDPNFKRELEAAVMQLLGSEA